MKQNKRKAAPLPDALSNSEIKDLEAAEKTIGDREKSFEQVGLALTRIRDQKLFRASHRSFMQYCRARWQVCRAHADRLIQAAQLLERLRADEDLAKTSPRGDVRVPSNEAHAHNLVSAQHLKKTLEPHLPATSKGFMTIRDWVSNELSVMEQPIHKGASQENVLAAIQKIRTDLARKPKATTSKRSTAPPSTLTLVGNARTSATARTTSPTTSSGLINDPDVTSTDVPVIAAQDEVIGEIPENN